MKNSFNMVFFHDHIVTKSDNYLFSSGGLGILSRYTEISNKFTLATRNNQGRNIQGLTVIGDTNKIIYQPIPNLSSLNFLNYLKAYKIVKKLIDENDYIIARLPSFIGLFGAYISIVKKKKLLIEVVGCGWDSYYHYSFLGKIIAYPFYFSMRYCCQKTNYITYVTNSFLQQRYPSFSSFQLSCSDVQIDYSLENYKRRTLKISNLKNKKIRLGMIGSLNARYKAYDTAIKAIRKLKNEGYQNYVLEIVGGGNPNYVMGLISKFNLDKNVKIVGTLEFPNQIFKWLDSTDIYLQPSRVEGLPRSLIEAMSRGCTCIGSNIGEIPELLQEEFIHKVNDYSQLSKLILKYSAITALKQASNDNFKKSSYFERNFLDQKRKEFYLKFINNN